MHVFSTAVSIEILDGAAVALLAAAACARARIAGAHFTGAVILGCICAIFSPLIREVLLHGSTGVKLVLTALPSEALVGAIGAFFAVWILGHKTHRLFFWLDSAGMCLAASLAASLSVPDLGVAGALIIGMICALTPGLLRDTALGDTAMCVEQDWYAVAAALAAIGAMGIIVLPAFCGMPGIFLQRLGEWAVLGGAVLGMGIRYWKSAPNDF